jgi:LuxR family maltose regulon positive regulatory protein
VATDQPDASLRQVEERGLFLIPLDQERRWYRYHAVFRQYLRDRLQALDPAAERRINATVSRWFERQGDGVEAVSYALRAGETDRAADLLESLAEDLLLHRGEAHTLARLANQLPDDACLRRPSLHQFHAWALVLLGRLDDAAAIADRLEASNEDMAAQIAGIRSRIAAYRGDQEDAIRHATSALGNGQGGPVKQWFRADTLLSLGFAYRVTGRIDEALDAFNQASVAGWSCGFAHGALWGTRYAALTLMSQGRLRDAEEVVERGFDRAAATGMDHGAPLAALLTSRGEIRYEHNDLTGARADLERALAIAQDVGDAKMLMNAYVAMSQLEQAAGDDELARRYAHRATLVFDGPGEKANAAWIALRQGDLGSVRRWIEQYTRDAGEAPDLCIGEGEQIMLGRAMLATGDSSRAARFLEDLLAQADDSGRAGRAMTIRLLLAVAVSTNGDEARATEYLQPAMDLAMAEGYCRSLLDEGPAVSGLLRRWASGQVPRELRRFALRVLAPGGQLDTNSGHTGALLEPLTPRQREVLALMEDGLSNREIAARLFLSEGTVKAHMHQIYARLMVRNRAEALVAARELQLTSRD